MNTFKLMISSPDGNIFEGEAYMLTVRGTEGELAVLKGHVPFVTSVVPCDIKIELPDEEQEALIGHTEGGILSVSNTSTTLLSTSFSWKEN